MQLCVNLVALLHSFYKETDIKLIAKSLVEHLKLAFTCHKLRSENLLAVGPLQSKISMKKNQRTYLLKKNMKASLLPLF